ncbi:hypothetical protein EHF33_07110 [Deinococcus psychrotolerans]|uniref:DUF11 domain-containing protein n=1 Tax=Deinococcus psychrotolerans TaxID=2489213 RepID=A0A3G8YB00_9DEIO|nr:hypothetical protein [Deinococcus psychrotolerans]AZI42542.1 hypothetical protein EHF33_07110 [Deinococcus psychrotolerans]
MKASIPILLVGLVTSAALAQASSPLKLVLSQALVQTTTQDGKTVEKLAPDPKSVLPGAVLEQAVTATNTLGKVMTKVSVNLPVPVGTVYLNTLKSVETVQTLFSIDKGKTFAAAPLKKMITVTENGKSVEKEVEVKPAEYTNVRWMLGELAAGDSLKLGFRVKVN